MKTTITSIIILIVAGIVTLNLISNNDNSMELNETEFKEKISSQPGVVIDVRTTEEFNDGHLTITDYQYNFLDGEFEQQLDQLDKDKTYYLYCRTGNRSGQAADLMKKRGFDNVFNIGGFEDLANAGFETQ